MLGKKEVGVEAKTKHSLNAAHVVVGHREVLKFKPRHLLLIVLFTLFDAEIIDFNLKYFVVVSFLL